LYAGFTALQEEPRTKDRIIKVPANIVLNEEGVQFFRKHNMTLFHFTDFGGDSFGFVMESIDLPWLKKILLKGFVKKIELQVFDIARSNEILSDAIRIVFFSMFRLRINYSVLDYIYSSPMLRSWNRANPRYSIGPGVILSHKTLRSILAHMKDKVELVQQDLRESISDKSQFLLKKWDDKEKLALFIEEIITNLDPLILFILVGSKWEDKKTLIRDIADRIINYAGMIDVLDMASILGIELASASERSALFRVMVQQNLNDIAQSIPNLKMHMKKSAFRGTTIGISIPRYEPKDKGRLKFRFSFYNDAADAETERRLMEGFTGRGGNFTDKKTNLFFPDQDIQSDNGMRFYYLSMLRNLCSKYNILMEGGISEFEEAAVTTLSFGF
jgi:hypothetical protein